jgi:hypothetical protein
MLHDVDVFSIQQYNQPPHLADCDVIFLMTEAIDRLANNDTFWIGVDRSKIKPIPSFLYYGFHPDLVYASSGDGWLKSPLDAYNSILVIYGWLNGLSVKQTLQLFCDAVYERLGYYDYIKPSDKYLMDIGEQCDIDMAPLLQEWRTRGCFAHTINHPKLFVCSGIARASLIR